jgi:hypothetical protein
MKKTLFVALLFLFPLFGSGEVNTVTQQETKVLICTGKYAKRYHYKKCRGLKNCKGKISQLRSKRQSKAATPPAGTATKIRIDKI